MSADLELPYLLAVTSAILSQEWQMLEAILETRDRLHNVTVQASRLPCFGSEPLSGLPDTMPSPFHAVLAVNVRFSTLATQTGQSTHRRAKSIQYYTQARCCPL